MQKSQDPYRRNHYLHPGSWVSVSVCNAVGAGDMVSGADSNDNYWIAVSVTSRGSDRAAEKRTSAGISEVYLASGIVSAGRGGLVGGSAGEGLVWVSGVGEW